jgi:hypothetical protein
MTDTVWESNVRLQYLRLQIVSTDAVASFRTLSEWLYRPARFGILAESILASSYLSVTSFSLLDMMTTPEPSASNFRARLRQPP